MISLKEPDPYDSLKGLISNTLTQPYKNKIERKNAQLIFWSSSLLKLSVLYLLGTTQNQSYPYSIGITFMFFAKSSRYLTTLSLYLTTIDLYLTTLSLYLTT